MSHLPLARRLPTSLLLCSVAAGVSAGCGPMPADEDPAALSFPAATPAQVMGASGAEPAVIIGGDIVMLPSSKQTHGGFGLGLNGRHVLFLNTEGTDVRPGNVSMENGGIRGMGKNEPVIELAPFAPSKADRLKDVLQVQKLVAGWYADMNVDVVISRPLTGDYMMTVIGGNTSDVGFPAGVVGISPGDCRNNNEQDMNYAFSASLGETTFQAATTAAHEAGHALGLGHTQNKRDLMYPSVQAETDGFAEGPAADAGPCGFMPGDRQDSHQVLIDNLGERTGARPGSGAMPTVSFLTPKDATEAASGTMAQNDLTVAVKAAAAQGLDHVTVSISRLEKNKSRGGHPLAELRPPNSVVKVRLTVAGDYLLVATAYDTAGNVAIAQSRVTVPQASCQKPNDCSPGQRCDGGRCATPPLASEEDKDLRAIGTACEASAECKEGICAITPVGQLCTHYCNASRLCAGGLPCVDGICLPPVTATIEPKLGQLGGKCTRNADCGTGECSAASMADPTAPRYCTKLCDPQIAWSCPAGMGCVMADGASGMANRCLKGVGGSGSGDSGGCNAGGGGGGGVGGALFGLLLMLGLRRRPRPTS